MLYLLLRPKGQPCGHLRLGGGHAVASPLTPVLWPEGTSLASSTFLPPLCLPEQSHQLPASMGVIRLEVIFLRWGLIMLCGNWPPVSFSIPPRGEVGSSVSIATQEEQTHKCV